MPVYPITFSIPECKLVKELPTKTKLLSSLVPGNTSTYIYSTEKDYYDQYKESYFAITTKKAGWDCERHYEILACGCIPYFPLIEECPPKTMALLPKDMIIEGNELYRRYKDIRYKDIKLDYSFNRLYTDLSRRMLEYTKKHLTTKIMARYILDTVCKPNAKKILFLSEYMDPDYLRCLTLEGFKELMGSECHDYPKVNHIYKDAGIDYSSLYGRGFSYTNLIDQSLHNNTLDLTIHEDILSHTYDLVIYGSYNRGMPLYNLVMKTYKPDDVILLCGDDEDNCSYIEFISRGHHVFVRELSI